MSLEFVFPRLADNRCNARRPYIGRKDVDNLLKSVLDALNAIVWKDDRQIVKLTCSKWEAAIDEAPHVEVILWKGDL